MRIASLSLLLATALVAPAALAQTAINETRPLDARGRVDISNLKGRIEVRGWERNEVQITGSLGKGVERLDVDGSGSQLSIEVRYPKRGWGSDSSGPTQLVVMVPLRADLDIESVAADVHVTGVASGELSISTVSGSVAAAAAPRKADVETVSGNANLTLNSDDVDVSTVSGGIVLRGRLGGEIDAETVSGRIEVIVNEQQQVRDLSASTVSGRVDVRTGLAAGGEISMESVSGDLVLRLPKDVSAQVSGESFSGSLKATGVSIEKGRGPGSSFSTRYGTGSGRVTVETFSGSADVRVE